MKRIALKKMGESGNMKTNETRKDDGRKNASKTAVDFAEAVDRMRPADRKHVQEIAHWCDNRPLPVRAKLEQSSHKKHCVRYEGTSAEELANRLRTHAAFGSMSQAFIDTLMGELLTIWDSAGGVSEKSYNSALAVLEGAAPQNELEAMLVVQMIAANEAALRATSMIGKSGLIEQALGFGNLSNKYMRTFVAQTEALAKLRRGGEQIVKYIHVHEGGQAVVAGTINQRQGRVGVETDEQPCGQAGDAQIPALSGQDPSRDGVPVPGNAERAMSHSWREEPGSTEGQ